MKKLNSLLVIFLLAQMICLGNYWTQKASFPGNARIGAYSFSIGDKGYMGGGFANSSSLSDFWQYDKTSNAWTQLTSPFGNRSEMTAFTALGYGYAGMGQDGVTGYSDFYKFDPSNNNWTAVTNFPMLIEGAKGISADSVGFVYGGYHYIPLTGNIQFYNYFSKFEPVTETWTPLTPCPGVWRGEPVAFGINNKCLVGTGSTNSGTQLQDLWEYDILTDSWVQKNDIPPPVRSGAASFINDSLCYVSIGGQNTAFPYTCFKYNTYANQWTPFAGFQGWARRSAVEFSISGSGFVGLGGQNQTTLYSDLWEYHPNANTGIPKMLDEIIQIVPNPATEYAEFRLPENHPNSIVRIHDSSGKIIAHNFSIRSDKYKITCNKLATGLYHAMIYDSGKLIASGKFVVIK